MSNTPDDRPRNRPNYISPNMELSILLSRSLDVLGYNKDMIRHRVDYWKLKESLINRSYPASETINAGSQTEGVVAYFESDVDLLKVYRNVICADNLLSFRGHSNLTLFQTDSRDTEPGYTKLKLIEFGNTDSYIAESLFESDYNTTYISSEFFTSELMTAVHRTYKNFTQRNVALKKAGPAVPMYNPSRPDVVNDIVFCFKCYCPFLLRSWLRRTRPYNWPKPNIINDISHMEAHVVPVGCKSSDNSYQEWRICFTKAEIHLIHSLNYIQIKLYAVLKMVAKTFLKDICPEITSYIIKNIVLWMCELVPIEHFTEQQLMYRIFQALEFLSKCVERNFLSNYMIPERNLFHGRIEQVQRRKLIDSLSSFIQEGPAALFHKLDKICDAMTVLYQEPNKAEFYKIKRNTIEKLYLLKGVRQLIDSLDITDEESNQVISQDDLNIEITLANLLVPEWREVENSIDIIEYRLITILS